MKEYCAPLRTLVNGEFTVVIPGEMGRQITRGGGRRRTGNGLEAVVDKRDEFADLLDDLISLGWGAWLVATGIVNERVGF